MIRKLTERKGWRCLIHLCVFIPVFVLLFSCSSGGGGDNASQSDEPQYTVLGQGHLAAMDHELYLGVSEDPDDQLYMVVSDAFTQEAVAVFTEKDENGNPVSLIGCAFRTPEGEGFTVTIGDDGYPSGASHTNGTRLEFVSYNHTEKSVLVEVYDASDQLMGSQTVLLGKFYEQLHGVVAQDGARFMARGFSNTTLLMKVISSAIGVAGCILSTPMAVTGLGVAAVGLTCVGAAHSIISTITYALGDETLSEASGKAGMLYGVGACGAAMMSKDPVKFWDCIGAAIDILAAGISTDKDCTPEETESYLACYAQSLFWYDDCDRPSGLSELCPGGCSDAACVTCDSIDITIGADRTCVAPGGNIFFSAEVVGGDKATYSYSWNFQNGRVSHLRSDTVTFPDKGTYPVSLTISDDVNMLYCGKAFLPVRVGNCDPLNIRLSASAESAELNEEVRFAAQVIEPEPGIIYQYYWDTGGDQQELGTDSHDYSFEEAGEQTITVTVIGSDGRQGTASVKLKVGMIDLTIETEGNCADLNTNVDFAAIIEDAKTGETFAYLWDFGNGETSSSGAETTTYGNVGNYTIALTVTSNLGRVGDATYILTVKESCTCKVYEGGGRWLFQWSYNCDGNVDSESYWRLREDGTVYDINTSRLINGYSWEVNSNTMRVYTNNACTKYYEGTIAEDCSHVEYGAYKDEDGTTLSCWTARTY